MRIEKIHLKQVGPFEDEVIEFQPIPIGKDKAEIHIFTGANGSGKSTLLYALACFFNDVFPLKLLNERIINDKAFVEVSDDNKTNKKFDINNTKVSKRTEYLTDEVRQPKYIYWHSELSYWQKNPEFETVALAYSGNRNLQTDEIVEIVEDLYHPLDDALDFFKRSSHYFSNWIALTLSKEAIEIKKKNYKAAENARFTLSQIEGTLTEIIEKKVEFSLDFNPLKVYLIVGSEKLVFDVLPDGLKSMISWIADLLMRVERVKWVDDTPILERNILLFLDEIEVHLHPKWQRKILPVVQKLFPNAQIFISTHSPFVVNSVDDTWVYKLEIGENGKAKVAEKMLSKAGLSYSFIMNEIFDVKERFGQETEKDLDIFFDYRNKILSGVKVDDGAFLDLAKNLASEGLEVSDIINFELRQINRIAKTNYSI